MKKRKWLSLLLAVMMLVSAVPFFPVTADAADGAVVEVSTWAELKKALEYTTNCSVVKVVKDIETKSLNGHTGLHRCVRGLLHLPEQAGELHLPPDRRSRYRDFCGHYHQDVYRWLHSGRTGGKIGPAAAASAAYA